MFPLITWKEQAICLQKLQAVVITLSLLNFLEEYLIVKRTLTTLISLRCTGNVHAQVRFFSRFIHKICSYKEVKSPTVDTKTKYLCTVICPQKITHAHNVFEVAELCRIQADILKPRLIGRLQLCRSLKYKQNPLCQVLASIGGQKKSQPLSRKIFPKTGLKATKVYS